MDYDDVLTLRDISYFISRLLSHAEVLPPGLVTMLQEYEIDIDSSSPGRWKRLGCPAQYHRLAGKIGQLITDGEWSSGACLDSSVDQRHWLTQTRENVVSALQLLAFRGELILKDGKYYVGSKNEGS